jgi:hypothetical protein
LNRGQFPALRLLSNSPHRQLKGDPKAAVNVQNQDALSTAAAGPIADGLLLKAAVRKAAA